MLKKSEFITLGRTIRRHREALGIPQDKFAYLNGIDRSYYSDIERGTANFTIEILLRITNGLNSTVGELFADVDEEFFKKAI